MKDCLEVFITAFCKTTNIISMGFIRKGSNLIQTNHYSMQLLGDYRDILFLDTSETFALKNLEEILEGINDIARQKRKPHPELIWLEWSCLVDLKRYHCIWEWYDHKVLLSLSWIPKHWAIYEFDDHVWYPICVKDNRKRNLGKIL